MIICVQEISPEASNIQFKRLYLCSKKDCLKLIETEFFDDFLSYDDGVATDINDPFLLSYIYAN
jgi:hypothetical protein